MNDEYANLKPADNIHVFPEFKLESGTVLRNVPVGYNTYGALNEARSNCVVVCHALTGNSDCVSWWGDIVGPGKAIDTRRYFVVCMNILGSCYGTCGPRVTVRDCVALHAMLVQKVLKISQVYCVIGGSTGGMQALEWALIPYLVQTAIVIACGPQHTAWQIAIDEAQRQAIFTDPNWNNGNYSPAKPPKQGLAVARMMAMISYRSHAAYLEKFDRNPSDVKQTTPTTSSSISSSSSSSSVPSYDVEDYLHYQGEKLVARFDPMSYVVLTRLMDSHDIQRGRGSVEEVLNSIVQPVLFIGIDSDVLYPLSEQQRMHKYTRNSELGIVHSLAGHDGFLLEADQIARFVIAFLDKNPPLVKSKI